MNNSLVPIFEAAKAQAATENVVFVFFCAWLVLYTSLGTIIKVLTARIKIGRFNGSRQRYGPIILSSLIYSIIVFNPNILLLSNTSDFSVLIYLIFIIPLITIFLPLCFELLLLRLMPRWEKLKWLKWDAPILQILLGHVIAGTLTFWLATGITWLV